MDRRRGFRCAKISIWALICVLAVADLVCCAALLLWSRACCSERADHVEPNQLIVLLYGADPIDLQARVAEAGRLLRLQPSARVFCAGGARPSRGTFYCRDVIEQLAQFGFDRTRLSADTSSFDTRGNLAVAFAAAGAGGEPVIVSDALHLLRVRILAEDIARGRRYQTSATPQANVAHIAVRLQWEIAAYISGVLPDQLKQTIVGLTRD